MKKDKAKEKSAAKSKAKAKSKAEAKSKLDAKSKAAQKNKSETKTKSKTKNADVREIIEKSRLFAQNGGKPFDDDADEQPDAMPYYNRELSWLDFNARVLEAGLRDGTPLMERLRFLAITGSNLDEFFMVRVAGVIDCLRENFFKPDASGLGADELYPLLTEKIHRFMEKQYECLNRIMLPALQKEGFLFLRPDELDAKGKRFVEEYFSHTVYPVLTPLAIDRSRPFPFLANRSLNIAVQIAADDDDAFAVVQVPAILPRFVEAPKSGATRIFVLAEDIIMQGIARLFEARKILSLSAFRITRDSDLDIDEGADNLMTEMQEYIRKRKRGRPIRLELAAGCNENIREFLVEMLKLDESGVYELNGPLDLTFFNKFAGIKGCSHLCFPPMTPVAPPMDFWGFDDIFAAIRDGDKLVHHPYESFGIVLDFIKTAAEDENVLAIKQTLYRVSGNSPIVASLIRAAENGKQVTVLVELKARFDEENNILWAKKLEKAGCHVVYGLSGLKIHCKIALVVRREDDGIRRYVHMATGNYNDSTAKIYTDMGMFTCREPFGIDASGLFNVLTGYSSPPEYNKMIVAPLIMRRFFEEAIKNETANARAGMKSGITAKVNSLVDPAIIRLLYEAAGAGVKINLIVRGICCLVPNLAGVSENIRVVSIVGQLLEHSRIFRFENGGDPKIYMGSADWMPRNLDRRVELAFPIDEPRLKKRAMDVLDTLLADNVNAEIMQSDRSYARINRRSKPKLNAQLEFSRKVHEEINKKNSYLTDEQK